MLAKEEILLKLIHTTVFEKFNPANFVGVSNKILCDKVIYVFVMCCKHSETFG